MESKRKSEIKSDLTRKNSEKSNQHPRSRKTSQSSSSESKDLTQKNSEDGATAAAISTYKPIKESTRKKSHNLPKMRVYKPSTKPSHTASNENIALDESPLTNVLQSYSISMKKTQSDDMLGRLWP